MSESESVAMANVRSTNAAPCLVVELPQTLDVFDLFPRQLHRYFAPFFAFFPAFALASD
jgi:hypothetical protein